MHHLNSSTSNNNHSNKTNSIRYGSNNDLSKRTRNQSYELSQDLIDKQIELLERKYGGSSRAQKAALVNKLNNVSKRSIFDNLISYF